MNRRFAIYRLGLLVSVFVALLGTGALAASWSAFTEAEFSGITFDKPLQVDVLDYTITIDPNPTITVGGKTYEIDWVQSFYVLAAEPGGTFVATDGQGNMWSWDSKTSGGGQISGWTGQGNNRLRPGQSGTFHFATFDPKGHPLAAGFHVAYRDGDDVITGWYSFRTGFHNSMIPEPSPMVCFGVAGVGMLGLVLRRRRATQN